VGATAVLLARPDLPNLPPEEAKDLWALLLLVPSDTAQVYVACSAKPVTAPSNEELKPTATPSSLVE
jgi:hypothetical protein